MKKHRKEARCCAALVLSIMLGGGSTAAAQAGAGSGTRATQRPAELPGLQSGEAPWPREINHLTERLAAIGLPAMPAEAFVVHIHQRLTISVRGDNVPVPANIGINERARYISPLHTHDAAGTIHIESATKETFRLGQFFDVWGLRFSARCIGAYCTQGADSLKVFANGAPVKGDPRELVLQDRQRIEITFGRPIPMRRR